MEKIITIMLILILTLLATVNVSAGDEKRIHLIVFAQDAETEIDVKVADGKRMQETVDAGVTYLSYKANKPELTVWEYGEKVKPRVDKGRDGEWYCIVSVTPPGESVGE